MANGDSPSAGTYRIVNVANASLSLAVDKDSLKSGANVLISTNSYSTSQFWVLSYRKDGTAQILSKLSGKSIDVTKNNLVSGTNVLMYNDTDARNQQWSVQSDGQTSYYEDVEYETYCIRVAANPSLTLDAASTTPRSGANVSVWTSSGADNQRWMFVPVKAFASGGIYAIRSMLKYTMSVDVKGASNVRGANVQLMTAEAGNNQKFLITEEESGKWSIMNINSGLYVDVNGAKAANGTNVQQWDDNDGRAQRWKVTQYDTVTINDKECPVVTLGSYVTNDGATYFMDASGAVANTNTNVIIWSENGGYNQKWALVPTTPLDDGLPVPANVEWALEVGGTDTYAVADEADYLYPTFLTTDALGGNSEAFHEWRYRVQYMSGKTSTWLAWSGYTEWLPVGLTVEGQRRWVTEGLPATIPSGHKMMQYEIQIRAACADEDGELTVGLYSDNTLRIVPEPSVTFTVAGFGPSGLHLAYESDYDEGTNSLEVTKIASGGTTYLDTRVYESGMDEAGDFFIAMSYMKDWIPDGADITITYRVGTDQMALFSTVHTADLTVSYNTGSGLVATPTVAVGEGRSLNVTVATADITRVWLRANGALTPMTVTNGVASVFYPFGVETSYEVFVALKSGDRWGVAHIMQDEIAAALTFGRPCHAWNWTGGSFLLEVRDGDYLETNMTIENSTTSYKLNQREWDTYRFGETKSGKFTAVGAFGPWLDVEATRAGLDALMDARHVTYRSPHGEVATVAVLSTSLTRQLGVWECTVEMAREVP